MSARVAPALVVALVAVACASGAGSPAPTQAMVIPRPDGGAIAEASDSAAPAPAPSYSQDARTAFDRAEDAFARGDFDEAERGFSDVRRRFAYSRLAVDAHLRLGDIAFRRMHYEDAARLYGEWMHDHRADPRLDQVREQREESLRRAEHGP